MEINNHFAFAGFLVKEITLIYSAILEDETILKILREYYCNSNSARVLYRRISDQCLDRLSSVRLNSYKKTEAQHRIFNSI